MRDASPCELPPVIKRAPGAPPPPRLEHLEGWAGLLEWFYLRAGRELPRLDQLKGHDVPEPYKSLLVHSTDLTPKLEGYFRGSLGLIVLSRHRQEDSYLREVVLTLAPSHQRLVYGVIRILLHHLPPAARQCVLEERFPLGHILQTEAVPHLSWPQAFFRVEPDTRMASLLHLPGGRELYGRRNVLVDGSRRLLADVIEVLAPVRGPNA